MCVYCILCLFACKLKSNLVVSTTFLANKINSNSTVHIILSQKQKNKQKILLNSSFSLSLFISVENNDTSSVLTCICAAIVLSDMLQPPCGNLMQEAFVCQDVTQWTWNLWNACYVPEPWQVWTLWKEVIVQHTWPMKLIFSLFLLLTHTLSTLDIHFIAVDDLKTKAYESKEKIMSHTVVFGVIYI